MAGTTTLWASATNEIKERDGSYPTNCQSQFDKRVNVARFDLIGRNSILFSYQQKEVKILQDICNTISGDREFTFT